MIAEDCVHISIIQTVAFVFFSFSLRRELLPLKVKYEWTIHQIFD